MFPSKMMPMELYQLRTFATVAELGSLTQAAERLHLSQPAASAQIKLLEQEFEFPLFERKSSGLVLTRAGAALFPDVQKLLASADRVSTHADSLSGRVIGPFRLAMVPTVFDKPLIQLGEMMNLIMERHPKLDIEVQNRNSLSIEALVASSELDAGLALGDKNIPNIRRIPLRRVRYRIVAPNNDWGASMRRASWSDLASARWISAPRGGSHHQMAVKLFRRRHCPPSRVIEANSELVIISLVMAGVGLGLMREDLALEAEKDEQIVVVEKGRPSTFLQVLYRVGRENDPAIRAILGVLRELCCNEELPDAPCISKSEPSEPVVKNVGLPQMPEPLPRFRGQPPVA
jgi:DNA-binding transcriptional LysR family regulator